MKRWTMMLMAWLWLTHVALAQTVVTWNLEWYPGRKPDRPTAAAEVKHIEACREALQKLNPDIFIAEEVRDWQSFADLVSVVPGLRPHVVSAFRLSEGELARQQICIASKLKAVAAWSEPWQPAIPDLPRGFSFAALESPDGAGLLMVYGLHLKSNRGNADVNARLRNESVRQLLAHMAAMEGAFKRHKIKGWIAAGDLNTNHDDQFKDTVVSNMVEGGFWNSWKGVEPEKRATWRSRPGSQFKHTTFDYIFTKGLGEPVATMHEQSDDASDHWPVVLNLTAPKKDD